MISTHYGSASNQTSNKLADQTWLAYKLLHDNVVIKYEKKTTSL